MFEREVHGQYAGFVSRALALVTDMILVSAFVMVTVWVTVQALGIIGMDLNKCTVFVPITSVKTFIYNICHVAGIGLWIFGIVALPVYLLMLWWLGGQTIGMGIAGIRVVRVNGERLRPNNALQRLLGYFACILTLGAGFAWCIVDPRRQGLHDKVARTCVIYWRPGEHAFLIARLRASVPGNPGRRSGLPAMDAPESGSVKPAPSAPASSSAPADTGQHANPAPSPEATAHFDI